MSQQFGTAKSDQSNSKTSAPRSKTTQVHEPTYEQIQARAYEIFLARKGAPGDPAEDWAEAERQLLAKNDGQSSIKRKP